MTETVQLPPDHVLHRIQRGGLVAGVLSFGLCGLGGFLSPVQFFHSYLLAYLFWLGIVIGSLGILMIHHVAGGAWGAVVRRVLESATRTLPLMAILFVPLLLGMHQLYEWSRPEVMAHDPVLQQKSIYLNVPFFLVRAAIYFVVWLVVAAFLNRWSLEQDQSGDPRLTLRMELLSRGGLVAVGLTMTFASFDWIMSLEPHWFSTIYGVLTMGGQLVTAMAFTIVIASLLAGDDSGPLARVMSADQFHDLGKLLLAFIMLWAYFMLSQFLIIWAGNLPEEIPWYLNRTQGGWVFVAVGLLLAYFALPFLILLSRDVKRRPRALAKLALGVIVAGFIELFWIVTPAFNPGKLTIHWMDLLTLIGMGGIWLFVFVWQLKGRSLVAVNDPSLPERA
jgi:hypothetical protein